MGGVPLLAEQLSGKALLVPGFRDLFFVFGVFTPALILPALRLMRLGDKASGRVLLGTIVLRFLFCLVVLLVFLSRNNVDQRLFTLNFFYLYLFHSIFEIYCLMRNLRNSKI
jgi:hypothetical protein